MSRLRCRRWRAGAQAGPWLFVVLAGACGGDATERDPAARPHVLLISLDSTRRDLLSAYGHDPRHAPGTPTSPHLDELAAEGVLFEEAYATTSWTLPSHWTILSGEPELVHAVDLDHHRPSAAVVPLAERLGDAGYRTAGFFTGPYLEPHFGFDRGFDRYEACYGAPLERASERAAELRRRYDAAVGTGDPRRIEAARNALSEAETVLQHESHRDVSSEVVAERAIEELERAAETGTPTFVFAHFFDPHFDHVAPEPYGTRFDPDFDGDRSWPAFMQNERLSRLAPDGDFGERIQVASQRELENVWAGYEGELAWTDAAVGRILARLDELGLSDDTLVVVVSDHGDEFFEHDGLGHRRTLYEEVVTVPLLLRLPGVLPAGLRVPGVVSTPEIAPTVLDLAGLDASAASEGPWGSLVPRIEAVAAGSPGAVEPTPALGRFVQLVPARLTLRDEAGRPTVVDVRQVRLVESWRDGDLKLLRRAAWIEPLAGTAPEHAALVRVERGREARQEELAWIDLAEHPGEPLEAYSTDFAEPRAAAALARFQDAYGRLLARRGEAGVETSEEFATQLDALGYGGGASEASGDAFGSAALTLPVPRAGD